jgi:hypothetical protein
VVVVSGLMGPLRFLITLVTATQCVACASGAPPQDPCAGVEVTGPPNATLTCQAILGLARERLGFLAFVITSVTVGLGTPCPPTARCAPPAGDRGFALFTFWIGDPVIVYVHPNEEGPGFVAEAPRAPPDFRR